MRELTQAAKVAKILRQELKKRGIKCRATSKNFSMGDSVNVTVYNQPPGVVKELKKNFDCYEYGTFDAMTDCQGTKNRDFDGPQTKYLHINNDISDEVKQKAWDFMRPYYKGADELPEKYDELHTGARFFDEWATTMVHRFLIGLEAKLAGLFAPASVICPPGKDFLKIELSPSLDLALRISSFNTGLSLTIGEILVVLISIAV